MSSSFDKFQKRRLISSYFSVVLSIALVLFLLGVLGVLVLNANKVSNHFKEQITVTIYLKDIANTVEIKQLEKSLAMADYVKSTHYVSKEDAAEIMKDENGEDFMEFLGFNPLKHSIDVNLNADFVSAEHIDKIAAEALAKNFVSEVDYDKDLVNLMNNNVKKISLWVLLLSGIFALIAVLLINSSIRLAVFSKRFTIKTMQMVGATKRFIRRPFVWQSIKLGIIGALIACVCVAIVMYYIDKTFPELQLLSNPILVALLFGGILFLGIFITWLSTHFATQRFLNLKTDQLY